MKLMKRILATMLAAIIAAGVLAPMPTQAAVINGGLHFDGWINDEETSCYFYVPEQDISSFQYRIYYNSGRLKKTATSSVYYSSSHPGREYCRVEGLTSQACTFVSIRACKNGAWTKWSSKYSLVPLFRSNWLKITTNKYSQKATISWKKITGTSAYDVYLSTTGTGNWVKAKSTTGSSVTLTTFKGSKFKSGQTYYFKVIAKKKYNGKWIKSSGNTAKMRNGWFRFIY